MVGISAFGGYIPRLRLSRKAVFEANGWFNGSLRGHAKGERSMCNWDEDSITLAVEAARDCLSTVPRNTRVNGIYFASTSAPFEDRQNSVVVAQALELAGSVATLDLAGSLRCGTSGLIAACCAAGNSEGHFLVVSAEQRRTPAGAIQEMSSGDGAAALLVSRDDGIARIIGTHTISTDFVDHYRERGREFDYGWEERWIRDEGYLKLVPEALFGLFAKTGVDPASVTHFCLPSSIGRVNAAIAKKLGIAEAAIRSTLQDICGDTGASHALVMLVHALEDAKPGDIILVASFAQGCDVLLLEVTSKRLSFRPGRGVLGSLARGKIESNYNKFLAFQDLIKLDKGMRSELDKQTALSVLYRNRKMLTALIGGHCRECGTNQFPKSRICVNPNCNRVDSQDDRSFAGQTARILSVSADSLTYTPDPPAYVGMIQFEEGGRLMIDFTDVEPDAMTVGAEVGMVFRVKDRDTQRGFTRYFWKAISAPKPSKEA